MKKIDYDKAFGGVDPSFERRVRNTLTIIRTREEEKPVKKLSFGLALAIALCILISGIALAAAKQWGLLDFLNKRSETSMLPSAVDLIGQPQDQRGGEGEFAVFTVREAMYDGHFVHLVVDAMPKEGVMLVLPDTQLGDPLSDLGEAYADSTQSIGDYAKQNGKDKVVQVTFGNRYGSCSFNSIDVEGLENGATAYQITGTVEGEAIEELPIALRCLETEMINRASAASEAVIEFTLTHKSDMGTVSCDAPIMFEDVGLRIDRVMLTGTPYAIHGEFEFTVVDREKWMSHGESPVLSFALVNEQGEQLPMDVVTGWVEPIDKVDYLYDAERFVQKTTLPASEELPGQIILAPYDDEYKLYGAKTITLK